MQVRDRRLEPLNGLWQETRRRLRPLRPRRLPLPPELASAQGGGGGIRLEAIRWRLGSEIAPVGECRLVRVRGAASRIINTLIFPADPSQLPLFVVELLAIGGVLRLAFLDLQDGGLGEEPRAVAAERARCLAARHLPPQGTAEAPAWATEASTGSHVFIRPDESHSPEGLALMYTEYLDAWIDLALALREPSAHDARPPDRVNHFKQQHLAHWPGTAYLAKLFGPTWTETFLNSFLYR